MSPFEAVAVYLVFTFGGVFFILGVLPWVKKRSPLQAAANNTVEHAKEVAEKTVQTVDEGLTVLKKEREQVESLKAKAFRDLHEKHAQALHRIEFEELKHRDKMVQETSVAVLTAAREWYLANTRSERTVAEERLAKAMEAYMKDGTPNLDAIFGDPGPHQWN